MRILYLVKDHPPRRMSATRLALAPALVALGHDVCVVTRESHDAPAEATEGGVRVLRATEYPPFVADFDPFAWQLHFNLAAFERAAATVDGQHLDVLFADGWTVAHAAIALRRAFGLPLVARLGRTIPSEPAVAAQIERWLAEEADRVIAPRVAWERSAVGPDRASAARDPQRIAAVMSAAAADHRPARWRDDRALRAIFERAPT